MFYHSKKVSSMLFVFRVKRGFMSNNTCVDTKHFDRVVIGGGLFGVYASLVLAKRGFSVCLVEQGAQLLSRASMVNQARLHSGLHYPRSLDTAINSLEYCERFRKEFPTALMDFEHIYGISRYSSKTNGDDFSNFIRRLGADAQEISQTKYFQDSAVSHAFRVNEPTFDTLELRRIFSSQLEDSPNISVQLNAQMIGGTVSADKSELILSNGHKIMTNGLVLAAYAGLNGIRKVLGLEILPLTFEIADVHLVETSLDLRNKGFTVMDGPFWSMMPFGNSNLSSLTSVGLTPVERSTNLPIFDCQSNRTDCTPSGLADCNTCDFKPFSNFDHILQQMSLHLRNNLAIRKAGRLTTIKAVLSSSEIDDSRPTLIQKEINAEVWTIFSGKITTFFDIEGGIT